MTASALRRVRIVLFALVWFSCTWFGSWELNPNNAVRLFAAISLVERGDATIDEWAPLTIDKARFGAHHYSDKAPGMTLMAIPAVAAVTALTGERSASVPKVFGDPAMARFVRTRLRAAVALGPALLTAAAAVLLFDLALGVTGSGSAALFASLGYALGTPAWGWSTTVLGHAPVAALYVAALWGGWRGAHAPRGWWPALMVGASLGAATAIEMQAVLAGAVIAAFAAASWWHRPDRARLLAAAAIGGAALLLPVLAYNQVAFGTPFRIGYAGVVGWEGMQRGLFGLGRPRLTVLAQILVGERRGLIWVAPVLALGLYGLFALADDARHRGLASAALAAGLVVLLVNAAYVYWDGGNSTGPRHAIPLVGLWAIGLAPAWQMLTTRAARGAAAALLAVSIAINLAIASAEIFAVPALRLPLWEGVIAGRFAAGDLRTVASEWWGWGAWSGLALWAAAALPAIGALVGWVSRRA